MIDYNHSQARNLPLLIEFKTQLVQQAESINAFHVLLEERIRRLESLTPSVYEKELREIRTIKKAFEKVFKIHV